MHVAAAFFILLAFLSGFKTEHVIPDTEINFAVGVNENVRSRQYVIPYTFFKDKNIMKQEFDFSCGSAALGTLLNGYLGENLTEKQIIHGLMKHGDQAQIKKLRAFSLWDMQKFVAVIGYKGAGYTAELSDLENPEHWPAIVPIKLFGYRHFVVLRGVYKNHVFVGDPWMGNTSFTMAKFLSIWHKNILFKVFPNDNKTSRTLALKSEDLRIIDNEMAMQIIFPYENLFAVPAEHKTWEDAYNRPYDWSNARNPVYYKPGHTVMGE
jgi:hypothetical protein